MTQASELVRVQLSRKKGWRMPPNTVKVSRPGPWGNPWRQDGNGVWLHAMSMGLDSHDEKDRTLAAIDLFRTWMTSGKVNEMVAMMIDPPPRSAPPLRIIRRELRGKNLACWCRLDQPCHADVLLELANSPICEAVPPALTEEA